MEFSWNFNCEAHSSEGIENEHLEESNSDKTTPFYGNNGQFARKNESEIYEKRRFIVL